MFERDETPETAEQTSLDNIVATPNAERKVKSQLQELGEISTPKTEPKPDMEQMHPATVHQTTAKAPDSGLKLGFADINTNRTSLASLQNTPSRPRQSLAKTNISPTFQFQFSRDAGMSQEGQRLMESIRADAARIKAQMIAEKQMQEQEEQEADSMFETATGRKIAKPTAKAGRFSDVHMAEFKKMDSIANHPSAYRVRPGFARPTVQSLKRSSSKADLDELERPRTAGKSPSTRIPPPVTGRPVSTSPFKAIHPQAVDHTDTSVKRMRRTDDQDVSSDRQTILPRPVPNSLMSPTKSSAARTTMGATSPGKPSGIPRSNSIKSVRSVSKVAATVSTSPKKLPQPQFNLSKPLPLPPADEGTTVVSPGLMRSPSTKSLARPEVVESKSRLPTLAGLRSILRSPRKAAVAPTRSDTPKQPNTAAIPPNSSRKVDFTPSVKSRYAVKLAEGSPSPAKLGRPTSMAPFEPVIPYDSTAFVVEDDGDGWDDEMDDEEDDVVYPSLPVLNQGPVVNTFTEKAKDHTRRESKEFKSIFTTLHPRPDTSSSLTAVNTTVNRTNPETHASKVAQQSPPKPTTSQSPTIRRVRTSEPVQPFEDRIQTVPHGLPGKKRRIESGIVNDKYGNDEDAKENRRVSHFPDIPGAWNDSPNEQDEGEKRGGKRAKHEEHEEPHVQTASPVKKQSAAREAAAKNAKDRKSKASLGGVLSMSRLNMLARPKQRG